MPLQELYFKTTGRQYVHSPTEDSGAVLASAVSLFFPSFVRLIDVFNTILVFSTLSSLL
jgi:hypothetical protein